MESFETPGHLYRWPVVASGGQWWPVVASGGQWWSVVSLYGILHVLSARFQVFPLCENGLWGPSGPIQAWNGVIWDPRTPIQVASGGQWWPVMGSDGQ